MQLEKSKEQRTESYTTATPGCLKDKKSAKEIGVDIKGK